MTDKRTDKQLVEVRDFLRPEGHEVYSIHVQQWDYNDKDKNVSKTMVIQFSDGQEGFVFHLGNYTGELQPGDKTNYLYSLEKLWDFHNHLGVALREMEIDI